MKIIKRCEHCGKSFILRDIMRLGKERPGNYIVKENEDGPDIYYHKICYTVIERAKIRKKRLIVGINGLVPTLSYECELLYFVLI